MYPYPIDIGHDGNSVWATSPMIPEFHTAADDLLDLHARQAPDGMISALSLYIDRQQRVPMSKSAPDGDAVFLPTLTVAQIHLWNAMYDQHITHEALASRLDCSAENARTFTDLMAEPEIEEIEQALVTFGYRLLVTSQPIDP